MTPQFCDISVFNDPSIDWQAYKQWSAQGDGISRVAMRSSYGVGFTDQHFAAYRAGALAVGIDQILYYHYGYPQYNAPANEANWCHDVIGDIRDNDLIVLDYEENVPQAIAQWAYEWLYQQKAIYGGKLSGIYASSSYIQQRLQDARLAQFPLWLANWEFTPDERPPAPAPWTSYEAVQYTDRATNIPGIAGIVDASIFLGGPTPVQTYSPNSADFNNWFTVDANGDWVAKLTNAVIIGGNKALFSQLSIDGNTLPVIGLPRTNELYQQDSDGYSWSVQFFERGVVVYDPDHHRDGQPGFGASYLGKYEQFIALDPNYTPPATAIPQPLADAIATVDNDVTTLQKDIAAMQQIEAQYAK